MGYKIGLDIGISSIGYAILKTDEQGNPMKIEHLNSVIFTPAEQPKTGASLAEPRREKRGSRRRNRRTNFRKHRTKRLFEEYGLLTENEIKMILSGKCTNVNSVYELRVKALEQPITPEEMFRILYFFVGHRGFKSNRKSEWTDKDNGPVVSSIKEMRSVMEAGQYRTIGEYILKDEKYAEQKRNKADQFIGTVPREMLVEEITILFESQKELGNTDYSEEFIKKYIDVDNQTAIFNGQRDFDAGPGAGPYAGDQIEKMIGECTFEKNEKRAPKASYTFQYFNLLTKINNLQVREFEGDRYRRLSKEEREKIQEIAFSSTKVTYTQIKKKLKLPETTKFNLLNYGSQTEQKKTEGTTFIALSNYNEIKKQAGEELFEQLTTKQIDEIGYIATAFSGDRSKRRAFENKLNFSEEIVERLLLLDFSGFGSLSLKAMRNIIPYLEMGYTYDKSCEMAGYDFKQFSIDRDYIHKNVNNPVVKRAVSQTIKVVNAIIREYGKPDSITIELARELGRNFEDRKKIKKIQDENAAANEKVAEQIRELGFSVNGENITRFKLWKEQEEVDVYDPGESMIPLEKIFTHEYEVDHIIPYSISFDDSYTNKVLVATRYNREKGNRIPLEYIGDNERKRKVLKEKAGLIRNYRKREKLLKEKLSDEDRDEWKSRNLNDTRYMSKLLKNYFEQNIEFSDHLDKKRRVDSVNGAITAKIRARWGFNKIRSESDKHHALDAVVIACITPRYVKEVTNFSKREELKYNNDLWRSGDLEGELDGEMLSSQKDFNRIFSKRFPLPWDGFREEVEARMSENPRVLLESAYLDTYSEDEIQKIEPMFVVRKPNRKVTGSAHQDTIKSAKLLSEGKSISRVAIDRLKLNKSGEIVSGNGKFYNMYDENSDNGSKIVYDALKQKLEEHDGDGTKAFPEKYLTFTHNGKEHTVKRVKIVSKATLQVPLDVEEKNGPNSAADNGSMVRIDVFYVVNEKGKGKYMFVPIYVNDTVAKEKDFPKRAAVAGKAYIDWPVVDDKDFIFSLYQNDMIHLVHKKGFKPKYSVEPKNKEEVITDFYGYFNGADISTASIILRSHDNSYEQRGIGLASLPLLEKYQVDYFGKYHKVTEKKRQRFNFKER